MQLNSSPKQILHLPFWLVQAQALARAKKRFNNKNMKPISIYICSAIEFVQIKRKKCRFTMNMNRTKTIANEEIRLMKLKLIKSKKIDNNSFFNRRQLKKMLEQNESNY